MLSVNNVTVRFGKRVLFEDVNLQFTKGNCYGLIGANGAGKSTFLNILSKEIEPSKGDVSVSKGERISVLAQDHFAYDEYTVIDTVIMGNEELYSIMKAKDHIYSKPDFDEKDGMKAAKLEEQFAELDGWNAESDAQSLLSELGVDPALHYVQMSDLENRLKVKVLLAKALFGNPDILLLDEPTNNLDLQTIDWFQEFLINFQNIAIVVSHDRYFLNKVCTHVADVDFGKIKIFPGNYDFWYESSQLILRQMKDENKKKEEKIKELKAFIAKFSANASKSKQATSRKNSLAKIELEDIKPSNRRYPYIDFKVDREPGKDILEVKNLTKKDGDEVLLNNISFKLNNTDKVLCIADNERKITALFNIIAGKDKDYTGEISYGLTITHDYFMQENQEYFTKNLNLVEWLRQYSKDPDETYVRGFLGRMLFSGEEGLKAVKVLSGGEKVRCMLSKLMLSGANMLILEDPTNHLDMEAITALNEAMKRYKGVMLFSTHDHQLAQTVATKIIDLTGNQVVVKELTYDEYLEQKGQIVNT